MTRLEDIGIVAARIAHDINNQLTLILNHLEFSDLDAARDAATRCSALTNGILEYARADILNRAPIDVSQSVGAYFESLRMPPLIRLVLDMPAVPKIMADSAALRRILSNLVSNACDAMGNAGSLHVRVRPFCIEVEDSGSGIAPEYTKRIFEPFFSTKGKGGAGLGLVIVRDIMRQHGGSVAVDSEPGRGTRFQLNFRNDLC